MERTANTRPESIGVTAVWEFTVEGDVMKSRVVSGHAADQATWRRVSEVGRTWRVDTTHAWGWGPSRVVGP